jgi:hypothetical protein
MVAKQRFDTPESLYNRPRPLPKAKPAQLSRASRRRVATTTERITWRLSTEEIASAMAKLATDDAEGRARRLILYELTSQVPDFHQLTDEQRAILVAVKRDADLGKPGPLDWILLMALFGRLKPQPTQKQMEDARAERFKLEERARRLARARVVD